MNITPIFLLIINLKYIRKQNNKVEISITGISRLRKDFGTKKSLGAEKIADAPIIPKMLNIFEPITLPTAISECPFLTAIIDAAISGKDVPIAIIVRPISVSGTSKILAILTAELTTASAEIINKKIPKKINKIDFPIEKLFLVSILFWFLLSRFEI